MAEPTARPADIARRDPSLRMDLDAGLRFTHKMGEETRLAVHELELSVAALLEELIENGLVEEAEYVERIAKVQVAGIKRLEEHVHIRIENADDKYKLGSPDVPCAELIPLCRGRCCTLHFPLTKQDLNERVVRWDYDQPYIIQQGDDRYCVHNDRATRGCTVYTHRPAVCRTYDCRKDKRIWLDYERRIPAIDPKLDARNTPVPHGPPPE
jgi:Fe-S-cluster containining protein